MSDNSTTNSEQLGGATNHSASELCPVCLKPDSDRGRLEESGDIIHVHHSGRYCLVAVDS